MSFDLKLENGDLKKSKGALVEVRDAEKLKQDIIKIVSTDLGSNKKFPFYGSPISQSLIGRAYDQVFVQSVGSEQLRFAIKQLQRLQGEQLKSGQIVTSQEQISAIQQVAIQQNTVDPRFFSIFVDVLSKSFSRITADISVSP